MFAPLALLVAVAAAAWLLFGWLKRHHPRHAAKVMAGLGAGLLLLVGIFLVLTGKLSGLAAIGAGLWIWLQRALKAHAVWKSLRGLGRRAEPPPRPPVNTGGMSVEEAREILGLDAKADVAAIKAAHRRLMEANHPDRGGSTWIAARLNQARDRLLS
ncbi:MAG: hypothetical protein FD176_3290 [Rhodospirillaceae bacterium]|nr:MAG: hypothetical protein FD176_3290 [Rhodospirillaceae bacterium]TNC95522.1 MAG: hypothetical protein FD119_2346 [Stygiobacter sp.]